MDKQFCPFCGMKIDSDDAFCSYCGARLCVPENYPVSAEGPSEYIEKGGKTSGRKFIYIAAAISVLLLSMCWIMFGISMVDILKNMLVESNSVSIWPIFVLAAYFFAVLFSGLSIYESVAFSRRNRMLKIADLKLWLSSAMLVLTLIDYNVVLISVRLIRENTGELSINALTGLYGLAGQIWTGEGLAAVNCILAIALILITALNIDIRKVPAKARSKKADIQMQKQSKQKRSLQNQHPEVRQFLRGSVVKVQEQEQKLKKIIGR